MPDNSQLLHFCDYVRCMTPFGNDAYLRLDSSKGTLSVDAADTLTGLLRKAFTTLDMSRFPDILDVLAKCDAFSASPHVKVRTSDIELVFEDQRLESEADAYKKSLVGLLNYVNTACKSIGAERSVEIVIVEVGQKSGTFHFEHDAEVRAPELAPQATDDLVVGFETTILLHALPSVTTPPQ